MNKAVERKLAVGFVAVAAIVVVALGVGLTNARRLTTTNARVERMHQLRFQLELTFRIVKDAEIAALFFTVTGQPQFQTGYATAKTALAERLKHIEELAAIFPSEARLVPDFAAAVGAKLEFLDQTIRIGEAQGPASARLLFVGEGRKTMNEVRRNLTALHEEANRLLDAERAAAGAGNRRANWSLGALGVLGCGLLIASHRLVHHHLDERRRKERELENFFRFANDPVGIFTKDGRFIRANPAWQEVLGYSPEELVGRAFIDFVHPEDVEATQAEARRIAEGGEPAPFENRYRAHDGSWRWFLWSASTSVADGLVYAMVRDITERKAAEGKIAALASDVQRRATLLEATNQELEAFSYSVSHDLRAPLRHIDGYVQLVEKSSGAALNEKSRRYLGVVTDSVRDMGRLIDDLLEFSRMGRAELRGGEVRLDTVVDEAIAGLERELQGRAIVWERSPLPVVHGDAALLRQVFSNLIGNAVKYTRPRNPARIAVGAEAAGRGEVTIFVRDNGVGFDMRHADKLFGVFQRLHHADDFEGTGIGLANVRRIVARHGGRVWAEAEPDRGATFRFTLPTTNSAPPA